MSNPKESYDVIVAGAGPAGASASIHLATAGARVLLVEQSVFPRPKLCGEFITPECVAHFARLGVETEMYAAGARAVAETRFYARGGRSVAVPSEWFAARGLPALGLSRAVMDEKLLERAHAAGADVLEETRVVGPLQEVNGVAGVRLRAKGGEVFERRARVVVDATGRGRALTRRLGVEAQGAQAEAPSAGRGRAHLVAFKTHLEGARGAEAACEIYFYRGGYGGLSPVEGGRSNLCFIARARDVRERGGDAERVMREVLMTNKRAAFALAGARPVSGWLSVALEGFGRNALAPAPGLLTAGDAASFIDPFTGSGMLMALEGGELVAGLLVRHLNPLREFDDARNNVRYHTAFHAALASEYEALYAARFGARLRLCSWLRRVAFAPPALAGVAVAALGASASMRRALARATRGGGSSKILNRAAR